MARNGKPREYKRIVQPAPIEVPTPKPLIKTLRPRTPNQQSLMEAIERGNIVVGYGPAGCGKTKISVGMAVKYFLDEKNPINKIIITRPIKEAGEPMGFLPGTKMDKIHPYLIPVLEELAFFMDKERVKALTGDDWSCPIEVVPLSLMRGRNFHKCVVVADEMQNATWEQIDLLVTRLGEDSKIILNGDFAQCDLEKHKQGGLQFFIDHYGDIPGFEIVGLNKGDIVRHPLVARIVERREQLEQKGISYGN